MLDARFSHLYFYQSLNRLQRGLSAIAELLVYLVLPDHTSVNIFAHAHRRVGQTKSVYGHFGSKTVWQQKARHFGSRGILPKCPDTSAALAMCLMDSSAVQPKCLAAGVSGNH